MIFPSTDLGDDIMATNTAQHAYDEIVAFIKSKGGAYSEWYCGIASNWEERLFSDHQIPSKAYKWWIVSDPCSNDTAARNAEKALQELGCDGEPGGGDETTIYVYAYLKGDMTKP